MGMSSGGKGGGSAMPAPSLSSPMPGKTGGGMSKGSGMMPNPAAMQQLGQMMPKMFSQSATQGLIGGLGAPQQQNPGFTFGGGYYGGDALGTAGQLLAGGPPSLDPSKAGQTQAIGNFGPNAVTNPGAAGVPGSPGGVTPPPVTGVTPSGNPLPGGGNTNYTPGLPGQTANGAQWSLPGSTPTVPTGGPTQQYANNFAGPAPGTGSAFGDLVRSNLSKYGAGGQAYANLPQSFSPSQFNNVAQSNPGLANSMLAQGGQAYRNAVMQANGWTNEQMNQFINQASYSPGGQTSYPGFTPANVATIKGS